MKNKVKNEHSMIANIFYFLKLMYSVSPKLVIFELLSGLIEILPGRIINVLAVKVIVDIVTSGENIKRVFNVVIVIAVVLIVSNLITGLYQELFLRIESEKLYKGLNTKFYEKAINLDLSSYDDPEFYNDFILTIESSSNELPGILALVKDYIGNIVSLITISSILFTIDPICLVIILAFIFAFMPLSKKIGFLQTGRRIDNTKFHRRADYFQRIFYLQDYVKEVRVNNINPLLINRYNDAADDVVENQKKYWSKISLLYFIQEFGIQILGFMFVLPLYLGYCVLVKNTLSAGDFVATFNGAFSIASTINFLTVYAVARFSEEAKMIEKFREFLNRKNMICDGKKAAEKDAPKTIEIKNLNFIYPGNSEPTLKNINLTIKPYEKVALVGYNGAGKTTLTNLLLRLYDAAEGEILIDGENVKEVTIKSHRDRFASVFQDFQLFACTVGENISLDTKVDKDRALDALKHSGFEKTLENGIDTELLREFDDKGLMTSGGEAQKIAISRAFYKNCPYVILDEPSANLDPIAEYNLNQAMLDAAKHKTVIFISHRLSTTINADKIYVMENGSIIESGSHAELMAKNGAYAYMFNLQAEKYRKG